VHHVPPATPAWRRRENLVPGSVLLLLTALAWGYTLQVGSMNEMPGHDPAGIPHDMEAVGFIVFLFGWAVMMVAMMLPAALPLILLYRMTARKRMDPHRTAAGVLALLAGYIAIWTMVGLPIFGYSQVARAGGPAMTVLPGLLLIVGGVYQFTALKQRCHARCSSPLFLLVHEWRPGLTGAARLGVLHGIDCLGCCVGLMLALVALGMMDVAWMLTAAVVIFVEKTLPGGHRIARPLGIALVVGGVLVLGTSVE